MWQLEHFAYSQYVVYPHQKQDQQQVEHNTAVPYDIGFLQAVDEDTAGTEQQKHKQ